MAEVTELMTVDNIYNDKIILDVNDVGYEIYMAETEINTLNKIKFISSEKKIKMKSYQPSRKGGERLYRKKQPFDRGCFFADKFI